MRRAVWRAVGRAIPGPLPMPSVAPRTTPLPLSSTRTVTTVARHSYVRCNPRKSLRQSDNSFKLIYETRLQDLVFCLSKAALGIYVVLRGSRSYGGQRKYCDPSIRTPPSYLAAHGSRTHPAWYGTPGFRIETFTRRRRIEPRVFLLSLATYAFQTEEDKGWA